MTGVISSIFTPREEGGEDSQLKRAGMFVGKFQLDL